MDLFQKTVLTPEQIAEVRKLHFSTKHIVTEGIAGQYRSAFKGRGIEFEEVRPYIPGDDVRSIDWKVTARTNIPHVKSYREERDLTVMIVVDVSSSTVTGTKNQLRERLIAQVGAALTLMALNNNDKVGLATFSDRLETYHPPRKGRNAVWRILQEVLSRSEYHPRTDLRELCIFLNSILKKKSVLFIVSDFFAGGYEEPLATLSKRHDVTAIVVEDPIDYALPNAGLIQVVDPESNQTCLIDAGNEKVRLAYTMHAEKLRQERTSLLRRNGAKVVELATNESFIPQLKKYFESRDIYRRS
jgi:uncharacterized protein (DUF58 family)